MATTLPRNSPAGTVTLLCTAAWLMMSMATAPLASALRWINQRVMCAACKRQHCYRNQGAIAKYVHFTQAVYRILQLALGG